MTQNEICKAARAGSSCSSEEGTRMGVTFSTIPKHGRRSDEEECGAGNQISRILLLGG